MRRRLFGNSSFYFVALVRSNRNDWGNQKGESPAPGGGVRGFQDGSLGEGG